MSVTTILIVEDEPAIAETLAYALRTEGYASRCVGLGRLALDIVHRENFALIILDVGLPDMNGFDVCRELRKNSDLPIVFLTARSDELDRVVGLELGGDDYVAKPFSPREVVSRVRAILRRARQASVSQIPAQSGCKQPFEIDTEGVRIAYRGVWLPLTRYEYGLLAALLERPGRIFSRAHLMQLIWHDAEDSFERTVDAHIKTLRAKLRAVDPEELIETHRGLGYSLRSEHA